MKGLPPSYPAEAIRQWTSVRKVVGGCRTIRPEACSLILVRTLLLVVLAATVAAQDLPPPPAAGEERPSGAAELELLPDIGRIGAQVGLAGGASWNPFGVGQGIVAGGFIALPLRRGPGGRLSYEILISLSDARSEPFVVTDAVAYVANLAAGFSPDQSLAGPPAAPFPVRRTVRTRLKVLQVSPFGLRYTFSGGARLRPYLAGGLDIVVALTREDPVAAESLTFTGTAPFDAPLIGGQIAQAPELAERGYLTGQGNLDFGFHAGGGLEVRFARGLSLNLDYRLSGIGGMEQRLHVAGTSLGFHW
jgi:opacity protein-like surface antigen